MKKLAGVIFTSVLVLPSIGCGSGPGHYPGPWERYHGREFGYWERSPYSGHDHHRSSDSDAAILGAVLGTAAVIGTVLVVDAIRNQPATQPAPPPAPRVTP